MELLVVFRLALGAGLPLWLASSMFFTDRAEKARVAAENAKRKETGALRDREDLSAGVGRIRAHVVGDGTENRVNLGSSVEQQNALSGAPTLETAPFVVEDTHGRRFTIPPKAELRVRSFTGARRNLMESITKEGGAVEQRYSFEVAPGDTFVLQARFPDPKAQGVFREAPIELEGPLEINPNLSIEPTAMGCLVYPMLALGAACALYPTSLGWEIAGSVVWAFLMLGAWVGKMITNDAAR